MQFTLRMFSVLCSNAGQQLGAGVADYVKSNALQRVPEADDDDDEDN
jgi:hypothetical protein